MDVLFLDVEMNELSGLDLLKLLKSQPEVVIVFLKGKICHQCLQYEVTDYILKPVSMERFMKAVDRVESGWPMTRGELRYP